MKELIEYRRKMIDRLAAAAHEFRAECVNAVEPYVPLEDGGWNIHQIAVHTLDVHRLVYGFRVQRTLAESDPGFENFDGETYMAANYAADRPLQGILDELVTDVESLAGMLRGLPAESWARVSHHAMLGRGITLQTWVEKDLAHIEEHLKTIRKPKR